MMTSRFFVASVAVGCIAAAGVGGYLATRSTATGAAASAIPVAGSAQEKAIRESQPEATGFSPAQLSPGQAARTSPQSSPSARPDDKPSSPAPSQAIQQREVPDVTSGASSQVAAAQGAEASSEAALAAGPAASEVAAARPAFEDLVLPAEAVIGIRLDTAVSSETSQIEDRVTARVTRAVMVDGRTLIAAGTQLAGHVSLVERGGKLRERARVGVRFTTLLVDNETRTAIQTEAIFRDGDAPGGEATAKIGGSAVIGTIIGGVFGGKKGAAIGGAAGAAGGAAAVAKGSRNEALLAAGTPLTVRLTAPVTIRIERQGP